MKQQVLSIEQMQFLQELGIDTSKASMCWCTFNGDTTLVLHDEYCYESSSLHPIPAFTLQDILELLPKQLRLSLSPNITFSPMIFLIGNGCIAYVNDSYYSDAMKSFFAEEGGSLIDAAYNMLVWVIENGYIKIEETK